jgi:hypothetical protein
MAVAPDVHIFGKLDDISSTEGTGVSVPNEGVVTVQLCGYGSQIPHVAGEAMLSRVTSVLPVAGDGTFAVDLFNNTLIVPEGTYYTFTIANENGDITQVNAYLLSSSGSFDLDSVAPYDPTQPPPPLPPLVVNELLIVTAADNMVFDGSVYTAFKTTLDGNVTQPVFENMIPGNLYTFIILQDGTGGHSFVWPSNVSNATPVNGNPNGTTIQTFVADENGILHAIAPGTYYP